MNQPDPSRLCAAILLEEVAQLAGNLATRLRGNGELPGLAVARIAVESNRLLTRLQRHGDRLQQPKGT